MTSVLKIGLIGIGLDAYRPQFEGFKDRVQKIMSEMKALLKQFGDNVVNLEIIDSVDKSFDAGLRFRQENINIIFLHVSTYAMSSAVLPVVQKARVPVITLIMNSEVSIDYISIHTLSTQAKMTGWHIAFPVPYLEQPGPCSALCSGYCTYRTINRETRPFMAEGNSENEINFRSILHGNKVFSVFYYAITNTLI
jgi:hypothetical protein